MKKIAEKADSGRMQYASPECNSIDMRVEGVLCESGRFHEAFDDDPLDFSNGWI